MVDLSKVKKRWEELRDYKMPIQAETIGKLINFCCELEILERIKKDDLQFDIITLGMDIRILQEIIRNTQDNFCLLRPSDLEDVNSMYKTYKKDIEK